MDLENYAVFAYDLALQGGYLDKCIYKKNIGAMSVLSVGDFTVGQDNGILSILKVKDCSTKVIISLASRNMNNLLTRIVNTYNHGNEYINWSLCALYTNYYCSTSDIHKLTK